MKLTNIFISLLFLGITLSCETDNSEENPDKKDKTEYSFVKIEFISNNQTENNVYLENTHKIEFLNRTSITQTYNHNPLFGFYEISQFTGIDTIIINNIIDLPLIAVPINIENEIYLGDAKWTISNDAVKKESSLNFESNIQIESNKKLTLNTKLFYRELKTNFRLTLINNNESKEQSFDGKWIGYYPVNVDIETVYTDL